MKKTSILCLYFLISSFILVGQKDFEGNFKMVKNEQ